MTSKDKRPSPPGYLLLWILVIASLVLNLVTLRQLVLARRAARQAVADATATVANLQELQITHSVIIDQDVPIDVVVPLDETVSIPINTTIPVDTVVTVPVEAGVLGTFPVEIPILATIPVDLEVDVPLEQNLIIQTDVPLHLEIPIEIDIAETPLRDSLAAARIALERIAAQLDRPLLPIPLGNTE